MLRGGADPAVSLVTLLQQAIDVDRLQRPQVPAQRGPGGIRRLAEIVVGAAIRLGHDLIGELQPLQVGRRKLQRLCRLDLTRDITPKDRGTCLGHGHAIDRVLHHQ
jgi:hypothetical protein